jgi:hypothetical protein
MVWAPVRLFGLTAKEIISDLIDEHIERRKETLELLSRSERIEAIEQGKAEVARGVKGKSLDELEH